MHSVQGAIRAPSRATRRVEYRCHRRAGVCATYNKCRATCNALARLPPLVVAVATREHERPDAGGHELSRQEGDHPGSTSQTWQSAERWSGASILRITRAVAGVGAHAMRARVRACVMFHARSLPRSSPHDVANAHDRDGQPVHSCQPCERDPAVLSAKRAWRTHQIAGAQVR